MKRGLLVLESVDDLFLTNRDLPKVLFIMQLITMQTFHLLEMVVKKSRISGYKRKIGTEKDDDST